MFSRLNDALQTAADVVNTTPFAIGIDCVCIGLD